MYARVRVRRNDRELSVATSNAGRRQSHGERREKTQWHRVTVFHESLAKKIGERHLNKGAMVYVEGDTLSQ